MEKIKELIQKTAETKALRKKLAESILDSTYTIFSVQNGFQFISEMNEQFKAAGVIAIREREEGWRVQVSIEKYFALTNDPQPYFIDESEECTCYHFETIIDGIKVTAVDHKWKDIKKTSA